MVVVGVATDGVHILAVNLVPGREIADDDLGPALLPGPLHVLVRDLEIASVRHLALRQDHL